MRSEDKASGKSMDRVFYKLRSEYGGKVNFLVFNWESKDAQSIIEDESLVNPPASVVADSSGNVVEKFEGTKTADKMKSTLLGLISKH